MINLLPPNMKDGYRYARRNRHLAHWAIALGAGILGAALLTGIGYLYLHKSADNYKRQVATAQSQLKEQDYDGVKSQVKEISNNLQLVVQVLSNQVVFSELLKRLGTIMPRDTVLTGLAISQTQGAIDITAQAKDYPAATQLHVNLSDKSNQIFSKADIVSINCASNSSNPTYPCTVIIRALFAPDNPFMFISNNSGAKS